MDRGSEACAALRREPRHWLVTGAAGFIGSHLVEGLLKLGQTVVGLDDLRGGSEANLAEALAAAGSPAAARFRLVRGDVREAQVCRAACRGAELVLHQAALGSVPRSLEDPVETWSVNVSGSVAVLDAARAEGCRRVVYASSSSVYGDESRLPQREDRLGAPLSPYAASKRCGELAAAAYASAHGLETVGLRYFNVFGPRQSSGGPYSAVLPRWIEAVLAGGRPVIFGDGGASRDYTPVANVVAANLLAATAGATGAVYNVALGGRTSLDELWLRLRRALEAAQPGLRVAEPERTGERAGDVRHSQADVSKAARELGYAPRVGLDEGLRETVAWFLQRASLRGS